jgi:hypothetical protein
MTPETVEAEFQGLLARAFLQADEVELPHEAEIERQKLFHPGLR